jgi:nucleotide-binding universal stress UspA family protein
MPISADLLRCAAQSAQLAAERSIRAVFGDHEPGRNVDHIVEQGTIDQLIYRHSAYAAFVVLGSRSRHRIRDRLRPSTTNRITGRASCPVISIPETSHTMTDHTPRESEHGHAD